MTSARTIHQTLSELRRLGNPRFRRARVVEVAPLVARLLGACRTVSIEERAGGIAFLLKSDGTAAADQCDANYSFTCVLHQDSLRTLTTAERAVAEQLCEGRTLAQVARLRGVSANTVKSQVRQIFRKFNVETRVALVRRLCP